MDNVPDRIDSKFRFVLLSAHRAEQIMRGAVPRIELPGEKATEVGMQEILREQIAWDYGPEPIPEEEEGESDEGEEE